METIRESQKQTALKKERLCLKCDKKFISASLYNRICDKCTDMNDRVHTINEYKVRIGRGCEHNPESKLDNLDDIYI